MDEISVTKLRKHKVWIFITSSFGEGDPPRNALKFFQFLKNAKSVDIRFYLCGLGGSNHTTTYQKFPKSLESILQKKGGQLRYKRGVCDRLSPEGIEHDFDTWKSMELWERLAADWDQYGFPRAKEAVPQAVGKEEETEDGAFGNFLPLLMFCDRSEAREVAWREEFHKDMVHIEFSNDISEPGNTIHILAPNSKENVQFLPTTPLQRQDLK